MAAFYFDRAIGTFGRRMEADIEKAQADGKTKAQKKMKLMMVMHKWLGQAAGGFRTPVVS